MSNKLKVKIKKLHPGAIMPTYASEGAAAFDLYACDYANIDESYAQVIGTGLSIEIPIGYVMRMYSRSGHGFNRDVRLSNCVGVIDSDYRGEIKIKLANEGIEPFFVNPGDRIAQAIIEPIPRAEFEWADELSETKRGNGGFGSTGK